MIIRNENPADYPKIYKLVKKAFETANETDVGEKDFVVQLHLSKAYIPKLAFVAESDNKIIGHIMLTETFIETSSEKIECLLLAPLCVALEYRNKGIGTMLVKRALSMAKEMDYKAVFLCGDPDYYGRFNFSSVSNYQISYLMDTPSKYVLVCELEIGWLNNIKGSINIV